MFYEYNSSNQLIKLNTIEYHGTQKFVYRNTVNLYQYSGKNLSVFEITYPTSGISYKNVKYVYEYDANNVKIKETFYTQTGTPLELLRSYTIYKNNSFGKPTSSQTFEGNYTPNSEVLAINTSYSYHSNNVIAQITDEKPDKTRITVRKYDEKGRIIAIQKYEHPAYPNELYLEKVFTYVDGKDGVMKMIVTTNQYVTIDNTISDVVQSSESYEENYTYDCPK